MSLQFEKEQYEIRREVYDGRELIYRAFENIQYVLYPADKAFQVMNIFVPEVYYEGGSINGYQLKTAPIFLPNSVGGYRPGAAQKPAVDEKKGRPNTIVEALLHGYVVVSAGLRGRGMQNAEGKNIGVAPADICDYKAAVRYLRHNAQEIPGDVEKIISNGTSAGGAMSSLLGSTGDHPDYEEYLEQLGAAKECDHIFASSCYCPITNLEHADMAYEWEFAGLQDYHKISFEPSEQPGKLRRNSVDKMMDDEQMELSERIRAAFPAYVESLGLTDEQGKPYTITEDGGTLQEYVCSLVIASAQKALEQGADLTELDWLTVENGQVTAIDYRKYIVYRTRLKDTPAFDKLTLATAENELFGSADEFVRHFTEFGKENSKCNGSMAEAMQVKLMNPMEYIGDEKAVKAKHFRIRHGAIDRDTSLYISAMLAIRLRNAGIDVDIAYPWEKWHMGDYDLEELFAWIDEIVKG